MIRIDTLDSHIIGDVIDSRLLIKGDYGTFPAHLSQRTDDTGHTGIIYQLGILQTPEDISPALTHRQLLAGTAAAHVLTLGNNTRHDTATRQQTAADRSAAVYELLGETPSVAVCSSKGSIVMHDMLVDQLQNDGPLPLTGVVHIGPALFPEQRAKDRTRRLLGNLIGTTTHFLARRPFAIATIATQLFEAGTLVGRHAGHPQPTKHQQELVEQGTDPEAIREVARYYPMDITAGARDVMYDREMWQSIGGENIHVEELPELGHELVFTPYLMVPAVMKALQRLEARAAQPEPLLPSAA